MGREARTERLAMEGGERKAKPLERDGWAALGQAS